MIKDTMTVRFNTSDNPWIAKYEEITLSRKKLQHIVDEVVVIKNTVLHTVTINI